MPDINIGQMGHTTASGGRPPLRSIPKLTKLNGDSNMSLVYRNTGNNYAHPFIWAETVTFSGAGTQTLISGVKFHGMKAAEYAKVTIGSLATGMSAYITKNTVANTITITSSAAGSVDVIVMVGENPDVASIAGRGNKGAQQMLP